MKLRWLWVLAVISGSCGAQSAPANPSARLTGKVLLLKGLWADDKLRFDDQGQPLGNYKVGSPTIAGFQVREARLDGNGRLRVEGIRLWVTAAGKGGAVKFVEANVGKPKSPKQEPLMVEIEGKKGEDLTPALDAVFADGWGQMEPALPQEWKAFARAHAVPDGEEPLKFKPLRWKEPAGEKTEASDDASHIGGNVKAPKPLKTPDPEFSELARKQKMSGNTEVYLIVDREGMPQNVQIVRVAGFGLDEKAVEAVRQYRFKPATRNGEPVLVDMYVDVNFQIF